jgi:uncharacterized protein
MESPVPPSGGWALVTGASSGIGEAFARALAARGMNVVLVARSAGRLDALAAEIEAAFPVRARAVPSDLTVPGAPARVWAEASAEGRRVELLVNNAGFGLHGAFHALPLAEQSRMVQLNCTVVLELAHHAIGHMRARGSGAVVNVASIVAFQPVPQMAAYAATKAFVLSLSEALAEECRGSGVTVQALCPGPTPTGFQAVAGNRVAPGQAGYRTAEQVVEAALRGLDGGRRRVVPGLPNRLATAASRLLPIGLSARLAGMIARRQGRG